MIKQLFFQALDLLLPSYCVYCRSEIITQNPFCQACMSKLMPVASASLSLTPTKTMKVFAVGVYQEPLKSLIMAKKWGDVVACKQMGELIWQQTPFSNSACDYLVPIPLHWTRYAWRGYNQAHEIAVALGKKRGVPVAGLLKRKKRTAYQSSLSACQRPENVKSAFSVTYNQKYTNKHIVLVDDLMTTGATLYEAGRALLPLKPASVTAVIVARVV